MLTGTWTNDKTDLELIISRVYHQGDEKVKVKGTLRNKRNGIVYESKNYSLSVKFFEENQRVE